MIGIQTDITSILLQRSLNATNKALQTSLERLATGCKINHASDNAAILALSQNIKSQISGNQIALENVQHGVNLVDIADGALGQMEDTAGRIRDLALQAMNGTYSAETRANIQAEVDQLTQELYRQKNSARYNDINVFGPAEEPIDSTHMSEEEAIAQGYEVIKSESDFEKIKNNTSGKYCLMGDIDFSQISGWGAVNFDGELNGNGYSIKNLTINSTTNSDMSGLFESVNGTIENLSLENVNINSDKYNIGALAGALQNGSTITNCTVSGNVTGTGCNNTGGLAGSASGVTIKNCTSSATVTGDYMIGGLVGWSDGTIENCSSSGSVTGITSMCIGGLVGCTLGTIENCSSSGNIIGGEWASIGGLAGSASGSIDKSYATGDVTGYNNVGGLVGQNSANISNSYALGNVVGDNSVGGLVGENTSASIQNCYSTGTVTPASGMYSNIGGFVGSNSTDGSISNCYTSSYEQFYGSNIGNVSDCHGTIMLDGVSDHDVSWFQDGNNLTFLGSEFDTSKNPPDLKSNSRYGSSPSPSPSPTPTPTPGPIGDGITLQVGANSGKENTVTINTEFQLGNYKFDVSTREKAAESLDKVDSLLQQLSAQRAHCGSTQNLLSDISDSITTRMINMQSSYSSMMDTDYAAETARYTKNQILQEYNTALMAQANSNKANALSLLTNLRSYTM